MRDQFRLERYELQLFYIRHISVFMILYSIALVAYLHRPLGDRLWLMLLCGVAVVVFARLWAGFFSGMFTKKNRRGHEVVFLPLGLILFACYTIASMYDFEETSWVEMILLIAFLGLNIYAIYLAHYVRFVQGNRDADYMAVYHVTLGNLRAYRLWYLATCLLVISVAILPFWGPLNRFWKNLIHSIVDRMNKGSAGPTPTPGTGVGDITLTPTPTPGTVTNATSGGMGGTVGTILYIIIGLFIIFATIQLVRIMLTRITDAKTSMETDHVIDLKKALVPLPSDEVIRTRNDDVIDENVYARRIRRTFKRTIFDKFGDVDIPEKTPEELLGTGVQHETDDVLLEKYEKARYSNIPCTPDDVKAVKGPKQ